MQRMGYCYEYGRGTDKDINKAKEYYKKVPLWDMRNQKKS